MATTRITKAYTTRMTESKTQFLPNFPRDGVRGVQRNSFYYTLSLHLETTYQPISLYYKLSVFGYLQKIARKSIV